MTQILKKGKIKIKKVNPVGKSYKILIDSLTIKSNNDEIANIKSNNAHL